MRAAKCLAFISLTAIVLLTVGCEPECKDLRVQNNTQRKRISELESETQSTKLQMDQLQRQLTALKEREGIEGGALQEKVDALTKAIEDKQALIDAMQEQLLRGGAQLPVELSTMLKEFAASQPMVTFDENKGIVKFESDLLFDAGSDTVAASAVEAVQQLCNILASEQAKQFDIIIAGHTDDIPIGKPETRAKHPTNWHLSAHRAISVLNIMTKNGIAPERVSERGFGEYRPVSPNKPNKKGNQLNRRVEIYIVPKGM
ncbi:MAG: OmpA family protein [Sedimentisphaerales bacterium]|nr:OmpA family protein [Sedimentisphaerales bacterium]